MLLMLLFGLTLVPVAFGEDSFPLLSFHSAAELTACLFLPFSSWSGQRFFFLFFFFVCGSYFPIWRGGLSPDVSALCSWLQKIERSLSQRITA
ncbi:hypothetical protein FKM82_027459 [Ascaphus truei]